MEHIEAIRKEKGVSVTSLTNSIGIHRDTYYKWLRGERKPKLDTIYKICLILEIDFAYIVENFIDKK